MKVFHVALDVNPVNGGPPRSIAGLCRAEAAAGLDVTLFIHDPTGCETANLGGCKLIKGTGRYREGHWREDIERALDLVRPDVVHVLKDGRIVAVGGAELIDKIESDGFEQF